MRIDVSIGCQYIEEGQTEMGKDDKGSFTVPEIGQMLHVGKVTAYEVSKIPALRRRIVAGQYRVLKKDFWKWYRKQSKYKVYEEPFNPDEYFTTRDLKDFLHFTDDNLARFIDRHHLRADVSTRKVYVRKEDFIDWYMGQMKYHSDDPRLPPKEKIDAYTIGEIKKMLGIESRSTVYNIYRRYNLDLIRVDGMTLVVKESFDNWFRSQKIYPKKKKRKKGGK